MNDPFLTLSILPEHGSRFGQLQLGFDRVNKIREEHTALRDVAALLCGLPPESLTPADLRACQQTLASRASLPIDDRWKRAAEAVDLFNSAGPANRARAAADASLWMLAIARG